MLAFEAFHEQNGQRSDFVVWQKVARPLSELNSLQGILRLSALAATLRAAKGNVIDKLAGQATGEFYLVRECSVNAHRATAGGPDCEAGSSSNRLKTRAIHRCMA